MGRRDMSKMFGYVFYMMVGLLLIWTASLDVAFIRRVIPDNKLLPYFGLVLFDGGMLGWLAMYIYRARGTTQRMLAMIMTIIDLIGIGVLSFAELVEQAGDLFQMNLENMGTIVVMVIVIWTFVSVAAGVVFELAEPSIMEKTSIQAVEDIIISQAMEQFEENAPKIARTLSKELSGQMLKNLVTKVGTRLGDDEDVEYEVTKHKKGYKDKKARRRRQKKKIASKPRVVPQPAPQPQVVSQTKPVEEIHQQFYPED